MASSPRIMVGIALALSRDARMAAMSPPPAQATSARVKVAAVPGSPRMPQSITVTPTPRRSNSRRTKATSAPLVSSVAAITTADRLLVVIVASGAALERGSLRNGGFLRRAPVLLDVFGNFDFEDALLQARTHEPVQREAIHDRFDQQRL